jgi:hypothetical protein
VTGVKYPSNENHMPVKTTYYEDGADAGYVRVLKTVEKGKVEDIRYKVIKTCCGIVSEMSHVQVRYADRHSSARCMSCEMTARAEATRKAGEQRSEQDKLTRIDMSVSADFVAGWGLPLKVRPSRG